MPCQSPWYLHGWKETLAATTQLHREQQVDILCLPAFFVSTLTHIWKQHTMSMAPAPGAGGWNSAHRRMHACMRAAPLSVMAVGGLGPPQADMHSTAHKARRFYACALPRQAQHTAAALATAAHAASVTSQGCLSRDWRETASMTTTSGHLCPLICK